MINSILTSDQIDAVRTLVDLFARLCIPYRCTGGLAGNFYGSRWPLSDIDIDVRGCDLPVVAAALGSNITMSPHRVVDDEFDIVLLKARVSGVEAEIIQGEEAFINVGGVWERFDVDVNRAARVHWGGIDIPLIPLDELIGYKRKLGRQADVADLLDVRRRYSHHKITKQGVGKWRPESLP